MATIVFGSVGSLFGGPLGGAIGSLIGRQIDGALFGGSNRQVGRLKELDTTTSSYGQLIARHFGMMRVSGSIIWATDLVEHSETQGGGKGTTSVTNYTYSVSLAIALASRPIQRIGRIWADGKLLRGAAGDLKVGGSLRIYTGTGDQPQDPLLAAAEGSDRSPAYRDLAYVVFEDLDLSDYYNRIPSLTFEVIADDSFDLQSLLGEVMDGVDAAIAMDGMTGFTCDGSLADTLDILSEVLPVEINCTGDVIVVTPERQQAEAIALTEPALPTKDDSFGSQSGFTRYRDKPSDLPPTVLRYYDTGREYQTGVQRAARRPAAGEPQTIELPAALDASTARAMIENVASRNDWSREHISWRTCELNPAIGPGSVVTLPKLAGIWRVNDWEWGESGVEFSLRRMVPNGLQPITWLGAEPGRNNPASDFPIGATAMLAFELPNLPGAQNDTARVVAAVSSSSTAWSGAALYADRGDGALLALGGSGRTRSLIGTALSALPSASPHIADRSSRLEVQLVGTDMLLSDANLSQLAEGANIAVVGNELIQFAKAEAMDNGRWRLSGLLRGRGGTEHAIAGHVAGESFALIDSRPISIDIDVLGTASGRFVVALGRGDAAPIEAAPALNGISRRPPVPVHPRVLETTDGGLRLSWTRRARGAWYWSDGVDAPLVEEAERYQVSFGDVEAPVRVWSTTAPSLDIDAALLADLTTAYPGQIFAVRQQGTFALSLPLLLNTSA